MSIKLEEKKRERIQLRLHPEKDSDIIEYLNDKDITDTIKKLLREKILMEKWGAQVVAVPKEDKHPISLKHESVSKVNPSLNKEQFEIDKSENASANDVSQDLF